MLGMLAALLIVSAAWAATESPREQSDNGTPARDVTCREGLELVVRVGGGPACVRPETAMAMQERGIILEHIGPTKQVQAKNDPGSGDPGSGDPGKRATSTIRGVPASGTVDFYIYDDDLNTSHAGVDRIPTAGLVEFAVNGITIDGPDTMIETGPDTGRFLVRVQLPDTINGRPLDSGDILTATYMDMSDYSGSIRTLTESVAVTSAFASVDTAGSARIGRDITVRVHEPDANLDSRDEDRIPLESLGFETQGRIRTTLAHPAFDANSKYLIETGPNTGIFEVTVEIPRHIDGETIHIGHWYEITYTDLSNPAGTPEETVLRGTIGIPRK